MTIIQNPKSGEEALSGSELLAEVDRAGHRASYASTDDEDAVAGHLKDPGDLVVIAGGDGTVRDVARRLIGKNVPLTIIPTGTANNISRSLGFSGDAHDLIAGWSTARHVMFDTCLVRGTCGPKAMFEGAGIGPIAVTIAALSQLTDDEARALWSEHEVRRDLKVLREIVADHPTCDCQVTLDGRDLSGAYLVAEVMNIQSVGPNVDLAPEADVSDGLFDLVLLTEPDRVKLRDYLTARLEGKHPLLGATVHRGREVHIRWKGSRIHIDDEIWPEERAAATGEYRRGGDTVELEVLTCPDPVEVLVPRTA